MSRAALGARPTSPRVSDLLVRDLAGKVVHNTKLTGFATGRQQWAHSYTSSRRWSARKIRCSRSPLGSLSDSFAVAGPAGSGSGAAEISAPRARR